METDLPYLEPGGNYVFISNHQSYLDIPLILSLFPDLDLRFLAKDSLFRIPIFGPGMWHTGHFSVNRENRRQGMKDLERVVQALKQGESALIFPEGTRNSQAEELLPFQSGAFIIVLKSGLPMVPIVLDGTRESLPRGAKTMRPARIRVKALEPMDVQGSYSLKDREILKEEVRSTMQKELQELRKWEKEATG